MGVYTYTVIDQNSPVAPSRLFKALVLDNHITMPKVVPQAIASIEFVEGDSTVVGCVKQTNFANGTYLKSKLDELDVDNYSFKYTNFEGNALGDKIESVVYEGQISASGAGSHYKLVGHFHTKGDAVLTEEDVKFRILGGLKAYEAGGEYLLNNPDVYA